MVRLAKYNKYNGLTALVGLAVLGSAVPVVQAQSPYFQVRPGLTLQQYAFNLATLGRAFSSVPPLMMGANPYLGASNPFAGSLYSASIGTLANPYASLYANPYLATNSYSTASPGLQGSASSNSSYPSYYEDPFGSYLRGGAAVITAQGQFMIHEQQARSLREQVRSERVVNRKKVFDEYLYERERTPTAEQQREEARLLQRDRSRNNPPLTEVYSAKALNDLLVDVQRLQGTAAFTTDRQRGPQLWVDEQTLKRINFSSVKGGGNIGLLKYDGRLTWPVGLLGDSFKPPRERLSSLAQQVVGLIGTTNRVDAGTLQQMAADVDTLQNQLSQQVHELTPAQYIEARQYLHGLEDVLRALRQPDVGNFFSGKYTPKVKTIGELVDFLSKNGLQFAAATPGDESAYAALYRALATYDGTVQEPVAGQR